MESGKDSEKSGFFVFFASFRKKSLDTSRSATI